MVYPDGTSYGHLTIDDVPRIVNQHIVGNIEVAEKALPF
jgi:(2Fe-2S) ferredoxin